MLDGLYRAAGAKLRSSVTEDIQAVYVHIDRTGAQPTDGWELEIYDLADLAGGVVQTSIFRPDSDLLVSDAMLGWDEFLGTSTVALYSFIDHVSNTPGTYNGKDIYNNSFVGPVFGGDGAVAFTFAGMGGTFTGQQVLEVRLRARVQELLAAALTSGATFTPFLYRGGLRYRNQPQTYMGEAAEFYEMSSSWTANPQTGRSWTAADMSEFSSGEWGAGWEIAPTLNSNNFAIIYQGWLEVDAGPSEKRLAVGGLRPAPNLSNGWYRIVLLDLDGNEVPWSKANGDEYLFVLRRRMGTGWIKWRQVLGDLTLPNGWSQGLPNVVPSGRIAGLVDGGADAIGDIDQPGAFTLILERDDDDLSQDSQPYASVNDDVSGKQGFFNYWTRVFSGQTLTQEMTAAGNVDVGWVRVLACAQDPETVDPLTVELIVRPVNTVLQTVTFDPSLLGDRPTRFQTLEDYWPSEEPLTSGTQYALRFSCPADDGLGWRVQVLSTVKLGNLGAPPAGVVDVDFTQGVDFLSVGATDYGELTASATTHTLAEVPGSFAVAATGELDGIDSIVATWTATSISEGGGFAAYELERSDDGGTSWHRIADITTESVEEFTDYESRRNVETAYRIRSRRVDGSVSEWSDTEVATATLSRCGYVLANNAAADQVQWYDTIGPITEFEFPERADVVSAIGGRDYQLMFREQESRGDVFELDVFIAGQGAKGGTPESPVATGRQAFEALRVLIGNLRNPSTGRKTLLPYIAVMNQDGDRWLAGISTQSGTRNEPGGIYVQTIRVVEVTNTPQSVDVEP